MKLDVTAEEEKHMVSIKSLEAKAEDRKIANREKKKRKRQDKHLSNDTLKAAIIEAINENPKMGSKKIADIIREKYGKCSENTVNKVKRELSNQ